MNRWACFFACIVAPCALSAMGEFARSYVQGFCFDPASRSTHEYHPRVLELTRDSLNRFEQRLAAEGFCADHRVVIMGYEQNAVAPYFDCLSHAAIDDEAVAKVGNSWDVKPTNLFGFLCGYLFKDAPRQVDHIVQHVDADTVELFGMGTGVLQKHALGQWYPLVAGYQSAVQHALLRTDVLAALRAQVAFLQELYESAGQFAHGERFATQDLLFSFYYLRHLASSTIAIKKWFVGPDITYPIQVLDDQAAAVTCHAQHFVPLFCQQLVPIENKKTAYIFCSFVDGVGKSTLLGNVRNWLKYHDAFDQYEHTNNTSSQRASIFDVSDQVCIVDLPAQMSHYSFRPDGAVYIDLGFDARLTHEKASEITAYARAHVSALTTAAVKRLAQIAAGASVEANPSDAVLRNVATVHVPLVWIPFEYEGNHCVVHRCDARQVRILTPFDDTHSQGLKIKEPELMIFDALVLPMAYESFMANVVAQLREHGVERVVYVDFVSMYPRTSRETIRVNYLLQQLCALYPKEFCIDASIYRPCASRFQLFPLFRQQREALERGLFLEVLVRYALLDMVMNASGTDVVHMDETRARAVLRDELGRLANDAAASSVAHLVRQRVEQEIPRVAHYEYARDYEVGRMSMQSLVSVWRMVREVVVHWCTDDDARAWWTACDGVIDNISDDESWGELAGGIRVRLVGKLDTYALDQALTDQLVQALRQCWCAQLVGLLSSDAQSLATVCAIMPDHQGQLWLVHATRDEGGQDAGFSCPSHALAQVFAPQTSLSLMRVLVTGMRSSLLSPAYWADAQYLFVPCSRVLQEIEHFGLWPSLTRARGGNGVPADELTAQVTCALATLFALIKCSTDDIMVRLGNRDDFAALLMLLERCIYPAVCKLSVQGRLFDDYYAVEPLIRCEHT